MRLLVVDDEPQIRRLVQTGLAGWQVRQMKTRWGSCNIERKSILLNLELAKKPVACLEYIIVHELLHLRIPNHGPVWKSLMRSHLGPYEQREERLRQIVGLDRTL